jgi:hypothetical protein
MPVASSGIWLSASYQCLGWGGVRCTVGQGDAAAQPDSARQVQAALTFGDVDTRDCERSQGRAAAGLNFGERPRLMTARIPVTVKATQTFTSIVPI